uniref:Glycosyl transferase family 2 n=1 Tax=Phormidium sp. KS TaxID=654446 RepID=A0A3G9CMX1_9CYAN|nr:glycosyl transferase family 2 [Phormidium sp. KS]
MALISVIIPVYNGEQTIKETIDSVLNQTFTDIELIVINDGSQDRTLEIVSNIEDDRLKIFSYPNAGVSESRNRGISHASGEYISFIDADDLWTVDKLELQLKALQENPQAAVAYSWTKCIDESGNFSRRGSHISVSGDVYAKLLLIDFIENGSNPLIRKSALTDVGNFDLSIYAAADRDMWMRLAAKYHFAAVPYPQILYRVFVNSMSANVVNQEVANIKAIEKAFNQAPASLQHLKKHAVANIYKGLTFKALEGNPHPKQGLIAARLLWHSVKNDPNLMKSRVIWKALLKIAVMIILPPQLSQGLIAKFKPIFNTTTLLGYLQLDLV